MSAPSPAASAADRPTGQRKSRPQSAAREPVSRCRSAGQQALQGIPETSAAIARAIGSTKASVSAWRLGRKVPSVDARRRLEARYGIPLRAWDERPTGTSTSVVSELADALPETGGAPATPGSTSTMEEVLELLEAVQAARRRPNLASQELVRLSTVAANLLKIRAGLESARELRMREFLRSEEWRAFAAEMAEALVPYEAAARAVVAVLELYGGGDR